METFFTTNNADYDGTKIFIVVDLFLRQEALKKETPLLYCLANKETNQKITF